MVVVEEIRRLAEVAADDVELVLDERQLEARDRDVGQAVEDDERVDLVAVREQHEVAVELERQGALEVEAQERKPAAVLRREPWGR